MALNPQRFFFLLSILLAISLPHRSSACPLHQRTIDSYSEHPHGAENPGFGHDIKYNVEYDRSTGDHKWVKASAEVLYDELDNSSYGDMRKLRVFQTTGANADFDNEVHQVMNKVQVDVQTIRFSPAGTVFGFNISFNSPQDRSVLADAFQNAVRNPEWKGFSRDASDISIKRKSDRDFTATVPTSS